MKKTIVACALLMCAFSAKSYDIAATVSIEGETKWYFDIELANNDMDFTAFQLDITLDADDAEIKESDMTCCSLMSNHKLLLATTNGHYRVVGYSPSNEIFKRREGKLFSFEFDGDIKGITINKIIFAKPDGKEEEADVYTRTLNRKSDEDAIRGISEETEERKVTYDMTGKQVYRIDRRGIYIQNGRKMTR